jgi:hypothetical protein
VEATPAAIEPILPTFACVGMERSGTTTLHQLLAQHPDIFLSINFKEHFYFGSNPDRGLDWYLSRFAGYAGERHVGDLTPSYFRSRQSLARLRETLGDDVRVIMSLRHPVQRAISHYFHDIQRLQATGPFSAFVEPLSRYYFVDYVRAMKRVLRAFPRESILVLTFERDIDGDLAGGLAKICDFLEIEHFAPEVRKANRSTFPHYLYGGDHGLDYTDEATGDTYWIPARWLVFCSGKRKGGRITRKPTPAVLAQHLEAQDTWTRLFTGAYIDELFERIYDPPTLFAGLRDLGLDDVEPWWSQPAHDIELVPAPPPVRFSTDNPRAGSLRGRVASKLRR